MKAEIKNLKKVAQRIKKALKQKERIVLYSDADLDGTCSLLILEESLKNLNASVAACYFPDREKEGYGLNEKALTHLKKYAPGLLILLDCGIGNFKEIATASKLGFEVIVIDHHQILKKLPPASIIVDPKQKGDKYPFKFLATCGLVFKLSQLLLSQKISENLEQSFLELVALGTLADMMPQEHDNKILIEKGLESLSFTFRPGLRALFDFFPPEKFSSRELAQKIISVLQITDQTDHLTESYILLSTSDEEEAKNLAKVLLEKNSKRQKLLNQLFQEISQKLERDPSPIVFVGGKEIPHILTGALATRFCKKFKKPTFVYNSNENLNRGSVRVPKGQNSVEVLEHCSKLLEVYGGHPPAAGFTCKNENLEKFKNCLIEYFSKSN